MLKQKIKGTGYYLRHLKKNKPPSMLKKYLMYNKLLLWSLPFAVLLYVLAVPSTTPFPLLSGLNLKVICAMMTDTAKGTCTVVLVSCLHPFLFSN